MQSSIGHAHWTVELECDDLFIIGESGASGDETREFRLTGPQERQELEVMGRKLKAEGKTADLSSWTDAGSITRTMMSAAATDSPKKSKSKLSKEKKSQVRSQNERLKIVIRRLPPNLPEEIFWQSVSEWVSDETVSWKSFHAGKVKKR